MSQHEIMAKDCGECLFTRNRVVNTQRARQIIADTRREDAPFLCHKATIAGRSVTCHGSLRDTGGGQIGRIATRLGRVRWIDPSTMAETTPPEPAGS